MIYICADDYGIFETASGRIEECFLNGALNKISLFVNFGDEHILPPAADKEMHLSLHLNLVEGKALSGPKEIITDKNGVFSYSFTGLLLKSLLNRKQFEKEVYEEIKAQIKKMQTIIGNDKPLMIDSHQHTHMIPSVMKMLLKVISEENIKVKYLRIPAEPALPFIQTPSLYFTYSPINIIKQWLLKFLWLMSRVEFRKTKIPTAYFFGIMFSGNMDRKRVEKILPKFIKKAEKKRKDIEVLFHPGYLNSSEELSDKEGIAFSSFYLSKGRKEEYKALINIK